MERLKGHSMESLSLKSSWISGQYDISNTFAGKIQDHVLDVSELFALGILYVHAD